MVVFTASFDTYLVIDKATKYKVSYSTTTKYTISGNKLTKVGDWEHQDLGGGNVAALPEHYAKVLEKEYPKTGIK